jgi:hypothetical protein
MELFKELLDYGKYLKENPFHQNLGVSLEEYDDLDKKIINEIYFSVDPKNKIPFPAELDDLIRLHYLVTSRKVTTILEIGVGKSTIVFDHALEQNKLKYGDFVTKNLRRSNPFECHSVDNNEKWIEVTKSANPSIKNVTYHYCPLNVTTFNERICTLYDDFPNICPDLIYLDAPDQFSPIGDVRGISTNHPDRLPMSADILTFEHFLLPGTLIVVDGRTANARFIKTNLQRNWVHYHSEEYDQHFFELKEAPLGIYNRRQIEFCLGKKSLIS